MAQLLLTGEEGFIGSHTELVLLEGGHELLVFDGFSNSRPIALERLREPAEPEAAPRLRKMQSDGTGVRDFIHVMDLAEAHRGALDCLRAEAPQLLDPQPGKRP